MTFTTTPQSSDCGELGLLTPFRDDGARRRQVARFQGIEKTIVVRYLHLLGQV